MPNTNNIIHNPTNLFYNINLNKYVSLEERDNLIHKLLSDCAFYLNEQKGIKTAVRHYDDDFFDLAVFQQVENYELLVTYLPIIDKELNLNCNNNKLKIRYEVYYKIEGKETNKTIIKECADIVHLLICNNYNNGQLWEYQDHLKNKTYKTDTNNYTSNQLITEEPLFTNIEEKNHLFFKQVFELKFFVS